MVLIESKQQLNKGDKVPDFSLVSVDGKTYTLRNFSSKQGLLVIFMCNHCPYVLAKIDDIVDLYKKFNDQIFIIGINSNDPNYPGEGMDNMKQFVKKHGIEFPYVLDLGQEV
ncbi:redoxin family protein, partial [Patescibacteria group bacterium AH-259-L07]|nr:redoxin family protein [Patescibacteria group bacterium AH-259-L07]